VPCLFQFDLIITPTVSALVLLCHYCPRILLYDIVQFTYASNATQHVNYEEKEGKFVLYSLVDNLATNCIVVLG
jgi:hypothetical protein